MALQGVNVGDFRRLPMPLPPRAEQSAVVEAVQDALGRLDKMRDALDGAATKMGELDRAVLAKAFRGELVPQDPSDEPAEAMLARLKAEAGNGAGEKPKKGRRG